MIRYDDLNMDCSEAGELINRDRNNYYTAYPASRRAGNPLEKYLSKL